jgi:hypothetical protein
MPSLKSDQLQQINMLKAIVGIPECENQAIHTTHSAQPPKHHDATSLFYKPNTESQQ